jgi:hypothetical protein
MLTIDPWKTKNGWHLNVEIGCQVCDMGESLRSRNEAKKSSDN